MAKNVRKTEIYPLSLLSETGNKHNLITLKFYNYEN